MDARKNTKQITMPQQTAVEWLVRKLSLDILGEIPLHKWDEISNAVQQAKEMENKQKIDFANNYGFDICGYDYERAEQYYNETYGKG